MRIIKNARLPAVPVTARSWDIKLTCGHSLTGSTSSGRKPTGATRCATCGSAQNIATATPAPARTLGTWA